MVQEEPTRTVVKRLKEAGFIRTSTDGRHSKWSTRPASGCQSPTATARSAPVLVRKINQAIQQAKEA